MLPDSGIAFYTNSSSVFMKQRRLHLPHLSEFGFQFWSFLQDVNQDQNPNSSNMLPTNQSCPQNSSASSKLYFLDSAVAPQSELQLSTPATGPATHTTAHIAATTPPYARHAHATTHTPPHRPHPQLNHANQQPPSTAAPAPSLSSHSQSPT